MLSRKSGSVLIAVLLLTLILLLLGLGFLTQQSRLYSASNQAQLGVAARALAEAGLEDARAKLEKDLEFPPPADPEQQLFTYSENLADITDTDIIGRYTVTIDLRSKSKNEIVAITSVGTVGEESRVQRILYAELDLSGDLTTNPNFFRFVHFEDRGGL